MSDRVQEILSWYRSENPGVLDKLYRILNQGRLSGTECRHCPVPSMRFELSRNPAGSTAD